MDGGRTASVRAVSRLPAIGIDVGASKVVGGLVDGKGRVLVRDERRRTPGSDEAGLGGLLRDMVETLRVAAPADVPVGIGTAGLVRWPEGDVDFAANHGHRHVKLRRNLERATGLPVVVDNDANAAAWSETIGRFAGESVLFLAVGTGLGSGFVMNGRLMRGPRGLGAELGHLVVDAGGGRKCTCGLVGCVEALVSGWALEREGRAAVARDPRSALAARVRTHGLSARVLIDAALDDDPDVLAVVREMGRRLGRTVADNVMSLLPVDRVVVGGGLANLDRLLLDPMRGACDKALARSRCYHSPRFTMSTFRGDAVLVGAALLAAAEVPARERAEAASRRAEDPTATGPLEDVVLAHA
jgi:glucokinase